MHKFDCFVRQLSFSGLPCMLLRNPIEDGIQLGNRPPGAGSCLPRRSPGDEDVDKLITDEDTTPFIVLLFP
jgi:hypothetical protein